MCVYTIQCIYVLLIDNMYKLDFPTENKPTTLSVTNEMYAETILHAQV